MAKSKEKTTKSKEKVTKTKEYKFKCDKKFLYVGAVKVQFINSKYKTQSKEVAKYLSKLPQIRSV